MCCLTGYAGDNFVIIFSHATSADIKKIILEKTGIQLAVSTIRRNRKLLGFESCRVTPVPFIRLKNQQKRMEFATTLRDTNDQFDDVIFTDETSVQVRTYLTSG